MKKEQFIFEVGADNPHSVIMNRREFDMACLDLSINRSIGTTEPTFGLTFNTLVYCKNYCGIEGMKYWQTPRTKLENDKACSAMSDMESRLFFGDKPGVHRKPFTVVFSEQFWPHADRNPEKTKAAFEMMSTDSNGNPLSAFSTEVNDKIRKRLLDLGVPKDRMDEKPDACKIYFEAMGKVYPYFTAPSRIPTKGISDEEFGRIIRDSDYITTVEYLTKNGKLSIHEFNELCWKDKWFKKSGTTDLGGYVLDESIVNNAYVAYLRNNYSIRIPEGLIINKQINIMKNYRKKNVQPMQEYTKGMDTMGVSVSAPDVENGSPKEGDMIATNPNDPNDRWLIAEKFFQDNYELADVSTGKSYQNTDVDAAKKNVKDIIFFGNGDTFKLISKASSKREQWMKSTKAMYIAGVGCVIQVTTQQGDNVSEALTFVAGVKIEEYFESDNKTIRGRLIVKL